MAEADVSIQFRALGDPTRRRIMEVLCGRCGHVALEPNGAVHPMEGATVGEVCCQINGSEKAASTISFHLKELRLAGLITAEKRGKYMVCSARPEALLTLSSYLSSLAQSARALAIAEKQPQSTS